MTATTSDAPSGGRGFALPSAYTILFILIVIVAILTWIIPAGAYDVDPNGEPIPGTYHSVPANPQRVVVDSLMAPINGLYGIEGEDGSVSVWNSGELFGAIDVALFILVIGGFLGVTMKTGAIQTGIARIVGRLAGRERLMIPILMIVFAIGGTTYGMAEESLAFYALIITVMIAAGYDALVAASVLLLGCGIGVLGSTINPFATGIASGFAGVSIEEGIVGRLVILIIGTAIGIVFVLRYADRVKADPSRSLVFAQKAENEAQFSGETETAGSTAAALTGRQKIVLVLFILAFAVMIYGVIPWEDFGLAIPTLWWWFPEMTASFLFFAILIGVVSRMPETGFTGDVRRRRPRPPRRGAHHRDRSRDHGRHEQRPDHRHGAQLGRGGCRRPGWRRVHQPDVRHVPAVVVPHPVVIRAGDGGDADHGAAGDLRRCAGAIRGDGLPEREWTDKPDHADVGRRHGRTGDRTRAIRDLAPLRVSGPHPARDLDRRGPDHLGPPLMTADLHPRSTDDREGTTR